ncbi:MAG: hypothetical protein WCB01_08080 [Candidatus Cybelea sp.]
MASRHHAAGFVDFEALLRIAAASASHRGGFDRSKLAVFFWL